MDLIYTLHGTLRVLYGSTLDGSFVTLPDGTILTLDLMVAQDEDGDGGLTVLSDGQVAALGCALEVDTIDADSDD
jgi:hypothetical protein